MNEKDSNLLASFHLSRKGKREVWDAWQADPEGVELCALRARSIGKRNGTTGGGALVVMIRRGEHLQKADPSARVVTGYRFVRGSHSGTFVRDPAGTDRLPPGYSFVEGRAA